MLQLTNTTEIGTEVGIIQTTAVVEATQTTQQIEPVETVGAASPVEVLKIVNLMELIKDPSQFSYCLNLIANDHTLTPTNKSFLTTVANIGIERGTFEIITDDMEIAAKVNRNTRTVRRWITRSIALGKISRHIIDYGTGKYCIRFLHNFLTNLSESQYFTTKIDTSLCPTKPTNTRGRKPKAKANNENIIIDQINNQNTSASLEAATATPATSLQPPTTITTPHLALAPSAPGQAESSTSQNLSPLVQSIISSSTPLPTDKMLEQLSRAENKIEPNLATLNNQTNITSINSISSIKSIKPTSAISSNSNSNKSFIGVARTATFGNVLVAQKQATLLQEQLEQAEQLFYELTEEQQDLILSINGSLYRYWQQTNTISELETKWKQSRRSISFDDFLDESLVKQSKLLYRKQYTNFITTNTKENAIELSLASLLEKWEAPINQPEINQLTTSQIDNNPDIIIKPSIQDIISITPEITPEIFTSTLANTVQSEVNLKSALASTIGTLDTFNQTNLLENVGQPNEVTSEHISENIINENVVNNTLTVQPSLDTFNQDRVNQTSALASTVGTLDTFNQSAINQNHQNPVSQSLDTIDQTTTNNHLIDLNPNKQSQQITLDTFEQSINQLIQPTLDTFEQSTDNTTLDTFRQSNDNTTLDIFNQNNPSPTSNPSPNSENDLADTVQSATNAGNECSNEPQSVTKDSVSPVSSSSLKGGQLVQHCPKFYTIFSTTSSTASYDSSTNLTVNAGTDNNTSFSSIGSVLSNTYPTHTDTPTSTISTSGDNMPSATTVPNSSNDTTPFKALKLSSFLEDHDLDLKEEKKSFKASLTVSGTNNNSGTDASSTSTTTNNNTNSHTATQKEKLLSDLEATFGHRLSGVETITRGDKNCVYCKGDGKLYDTITVTISTVKKEKQESFRDFRDQRFIPCICAKLYDMLEFAVGNVIMLGVPTMTEAQLAAQQRLISAIDEKLKANSVEPKDPTQQPKAQVKTHTEPQLKAKEAKNSSNVGNANKQCKSINLKANSEQVSSYPSSDKVNGGKELKNYAIEKLALNQQMLATIESLNSEAHTRVDKGGNADLVIEVSNDKNYCIPPNPYNQFRKSEFTFLEWLLYSAREPNRVLPVRMACQRYYLGKNDAEMIKWKRERAELNIGGSSSNDGNIND